MFGFWDTSGQVYMGIYCRCCVDLHTSNAEIQLRCYALIKKPAEPVGDLSEGTRVAVHHGMAYQGLLGKPNKATP